MQSVFITDAHPSKWIVFPHRLDDFNPGENHQTVIRFSINPPHRVAEIMLRQQI